MNGKNFLTIVGAPEKVFELCKNIWHKDGVETLNEEKKKNSRQYFINLRKTVLE